LLLIANKISCKLVIWEPLGPLKLCLLEKGKLSGGKGDSDDGNAETDSKELINKLRCCRALGPDACPLPYKTGKEKKRWIP